VNSDPKSHCSPAAVSRTLLPHIGGLVKEAVPDHEEEKEVETDGEKVLEGVPEVEKEREPVEV